MKTHLVGVGSSLNPGGVFVVERPGLYEFLQQLAGMAEVVVFTAGGWLKLVDISRGSDCRWCVNFVYSKVFLCTMGWLVPAVFC
jgi:hypothetical protein